MRKASRCDKGSRDKGIGRIVVHPSDDSFIVSYTLMHTVEASRLDLGLQKLLDRLPIESLSEHLPLRSSVRPSVWQGNHAKFGNVCIVGTELER